MKLVFDIGGTYMRLATAEGNLLTSDLASVSTPKGYDAALAQFMKMATELGKGEQFEACAGGVPGVLSSEKSTLVNARNLPNWVDKPLQADLSRMLGCPVTLANDTAIGALGEAHAGVGAGHRVVAYLAIGTGVGGCRLLNGVIDESSQGFEPGAQLISQTGRQAWSLEDLVSGAALSKKYGLMPGMAVADTTVLEEVAWNLAIGIHNLVCIWSPDIVVLGGGVINNNVIPLNIVNNYVLQLMDKYPKYPPVMASQLKDKAGLIGATFLQRVL